jgi:hypothetical protein
MTRAMREAGTARFDLSGTTAGGSGLQGTGALRVGGSGSVGERAIQLSAGQAGQRIRVRLIGQDVYVAPGASIGGKQWIHLDPQGDDQASKLFGGLVSSLGNTSDVSGATSAFSNATEFSALGEKRVDGRPYAAYRAKLDETGAAAGAGTGRQLTGPTATYTVYLDHDGLPARVISRTKLKDSQSERTVDYREWGKPVEIQAPPADQVVESREIG